MVDVDLEFPLLYFLEVLFPVTMTIRSSLILLDLYGLTPVTKLHKSFTFKFRIPVGSRNGLTLGYFVQLKFEISIKPGISW